MNESPPSPSPTPFGRARFALPAALLLALAGGFVALYCHYAADSKPKATARPLAPPPGASAGTPAAPSSPSTLTAAARRALASDAWARDRELPPEAKTPSQIKAEAAASDRQRLWALVLGNGKAVESRDRVAALRELPLNWTPEERRAVYAWLRAGPAPGDGMSVDEWHWLAHRIMGRLRGQVAFPGELPAELAAIATAEGIDPILRDYAVQHLALLRRQIAAASGFRTGPTALSGAEAAWEIGGAEAGNLLQIADDGLMAAARTAGDGAGGAALLGMLRMAGDDGENGKDIAAAAGEVAMAVVKDPAGDSMNRATALSVAARAGRGDVVPEARRIAAEAGAPPMERLAAIGALGERGTAEDLALLGRLENENRNVLGRAAGLAAAKIKRRAE